MRGYAKEELVAEIGSAFLCADLGITPETRTDHAAYIDHWLKALKNDRKLIFTAAAHATRAVEFLKSRQPLMAPSNADPVMLLPDYQTLYVSEPMAIGKHDWRLRIERSGRGVVTKYEFQDESNNFWKTQREWKGYDINDTYLGLPRGLEKLYEREKPALIRHDVIQRPPVRQLVLEM